MNEIYRPRNCNIGINNHLENQCKEKGSRKKLTNLLGKEIKSILKIGIPLILMSTCAMYVESKNALKEKDFEKARWIEYDNTSEKNIYNFYMKEKIPRRIHNLQLYERMVKEKNNGVLQGKIYLPDLDKDGFVGF